MSILADSMSAWFPESRASEPQRSCKSQFVQDIMSNLDGAVNREKLKTDRFDHHGFCKGLLSKSHILHTGTCRRQLHKLDYQFIMGYTDYYTVFLIPALISAGVDGISLSPKGKG